MLYLVFVCFYLIPFQKGCQAPYETEGKTTDPEVRRGTKLHSNLRVESQAAGTSGRCRAVIRFHWAPASLPLSPARVCPSSADEPEPRLPACLWPRRNRSPGTWGAVNICSGSFWGCPCEHDANLPGRAAFSGGVNQGGCRRLGSCFLTFPY